MFFHRATFASCCFGRRRTRAIFLSALLTVSSDQGILARVRTERNSLVRQAYCNASHEDHRSWARVVLRCQTKVREAQTITRFSMSLTATSPASRTPVNLTAWADDAACANYANAGHESASALKTVALMLAGPRNSF